MYGSGVYDGADCDPYWLDHAVVLVGFTDSGSDNNDGGDNDNNDGGDEDNNDEDEGDDNDGNSENVVEKWWYYENSSSGRRLQDSAGQDRYWKIQNSWGSWWGDEGFILFDMQDGPGVCGMNRVVEYVDLHDSWYENNMA